MASDSGKKTVLLKNVESNFIEDIILIMRDNVRISECPEAAEAKRSYDSKKMDELIIKEAELIINSNVNGISDNHNPGEASYKSSERCRSVVKLEYKPNILVRIKRLVIPSLKFAAGFIFMSAWIYGLCLLFGWI